jgi:hypothetical protein
MKILLQLCCCLLLSALPLPAAELLPGEWSGTYRFADDEALPVKYHVERLEAEPDERDSSLAISMNVAGVAIEFSKIQLTDKQLSFRMNPGKEVACLLASAADGTYKGECRSLIDPEDPQIIKVFMRPLQTESGAVTDPGADDAAPRKPAAADLDGNQSGVVGD